MRKEAPEELKRYRLYSLAELEPILGLTRRTLLTYVKLGKLSATKIGNKWMVSEQALKALLQRDD